MGVGAVFFLGALLATGVDEQIAGEVIGEQCVLPVVSSSSYVLLKGRSDCVGYLDTAWHVYL